MVTNIYIYGFIRLRGSIHEQEEEIRNQVETRPISTATLIRQSSITGLPTRMQVRVENLRISLKIHKFGDKSLAGCCANVRWNTKIEFLTAQIHSTLEYDE